MEAGRYDLKFQDFKFDKRKSAHLLNTNVSLIVYLLTSEEISVNAKNVLDIYMGQMQYFRTEF